LSLFAIGSSLVAFASPACGYLIPQKQGMVYRKHQPAMRETGKESLKAKSQERLTHKAKGPPSRQAQGLTTGRG
jgi:hypothetical protein